MSQLSRQLPPYIALYLQRKMVAILLWAFACGIPLLLVLSTLSARLLESGASLTRIGLFSLASLPYSLKFIAAPLLEQLSPPVLSRHVGRARAWMLLGMYGVMCSLIWMACLDLKSPHGFDHIFIAACCTTTFAALTDIAEAELRIELLSSAELGLGMGCYAIGYRLGMILGGGGALLIAGYYNWTLAYFIMACAMLVGIAAVLSQKQAPRQQKIIEAQKELTSTIIRIKQILYKSLHAPIVNIIKSPGWWLALLIIIFYNFSDDLIIMTSNPFYLTISLTKATIGLWVGSVGSIVALLGGIIGGSLCSRFGALPVLLVCGIAYISYTLLLALLAHMHFSINLPILHLIAPFTLFKFIAVFSNLIIGLSSASYVTVSAARCHAPYTATQNAILTSLMAAARTVFASVSGWLAFKLGWEKFFIFTCCAMVPSLIFIYLLSRINRRVGLANN